MGGKVNFLKKYYLSNMNYP